MIAGRSKHVIQVLFPPNMVSSYGTTVLGYVPHTCRALCIVTITLAVCLATWNGWKTILYNICWYESITFTSRTPPL